MMRWFFFLFLISSMPSFSQQAWGLVRFKDGSHAYVTDSLKVIYQEKKDSSPSEKIFTISEGLGRIRRDGKYGYMNHKGEIVIPCKFEKAEDFHEGLAQVTVNGKWGYIDRSGNLVISPQFDFALKFSCGMAAVGKNRNYTFIDRNGQLMSNFKFDRVSHFKENKAWVLINGRWGCINKKGEYIIPLLYSDTYDFHEGRAWVKKDQQWGMIDSSNTFVINPVRGNSLIYAHSDSYSTLGIFSCHRLVYRVDEKAGYYDFTLKKVIPPNFRRASDFRDGYALVVTGDGPAVIDTTGAYLVKPGYKDISFTGVPHLLAVKKPAGEHWGLYNTKTKSEIRGEYSAIINFEVIDKP
jgi:hypothetical protein